MLAMHHLRLLFMGLSALLAGILVWTLVAEHEQTLQKDRIAAREQVRPTRPASAPIPPAAPGPSSQEVLQGSRTRIADRLAEAPEYRNFRDRFAAAYPGDWSRALEVMGQRLPSDATIATPDAVFVEALKTLRRSRGAVAGKATARPLSAVFDQQMRLLAGLSATDKRLCVDYLFGEESRGFLDFAATHRALMAGMGMTTLDAILDGAGSQVERAAPTDADFADLEKMLTQRGLGTAEIEALLDGRHPDPPIADDRLCDAGLVYYDVLKQMPEESRLRIYALAVELMSRL
jgi:hypothetical protein